MIQSISKWLKRCRRYQAAVRNAVEYFSATTGKRRARGGGRVLNEREERLIVEVWYATMRHPGRAWYLIESDGTVTSKLSFDEARKWGARRLR